MPIVWFFHATLSLTVPMLSRSKPLQSKKKTKRLFGKKYQPTSDAETLACKKAVAATDTKFQSKPKKMMKVCEMMIFTSFELFSITSC